jgi:glutamate dehydrogenase
MKAMLGAGGESASGEEVIRRILTMTVDLLYNGGIGTYIKASTEEDEEVGDRANDRVRVDGKDVQARVIGEGGNLGLTQRGRIEYWARGGMLNTDAVDNSGGVDMSDHEVNIKILLDHVVKKGVIEGRDERNRILAEMTEEVAALVLKDNDNQARALTLDSLRSAARYEEFVAFVDDLAGTGVLDRADNAVPTRDDLLSSPHRKRGLPRPLLAVLLGHTKMWAFQTIMETGFPDSAAGRPFLDQYFPRRLREGFAEHFDSHFLKREIIATAAVNHLVNEAGITFLWRNMAAAKTGIGEVLTAYVEVDREARAEEVRDLVEGAGLGAEAENALLLQIEEKLEAATRERLGGQKVDPTRVLEPVRAQLAGQTAPPIQPAPAGNRA